MKQKFQGTGVAVVTPFKKSGETDLNALSVLIDDLISNKVDYLVILGTTAETPTLSAEEKKEIIKTARETIRARVPMVVGVGGNNTQEIVDKLRAMDTEGVDAILSVCPYYNKPPQEGIYLHFRNIAEASPVPVILYNVPGRTSCNISADTTLRLAHEFPEIIAIKEASGDLVQCMDILAARPEGFKVISGDDILTLPLIAIGADGVISVVANALPLQFSEMVNAALEGNFERAKALHYSMKEITKAFFADGNPAGVKAALEHKGICANNLRLPLVPARAETCKTIHSLMQAFLQ